jgi:hypothetical protein
MMMITKTCPYCGEPASIGVDEEAYREWKAGVLIQNAFPSLTASEREVILTGYHPECWDEALADDEEDDDPFIRSLPI